jgi:hypothetical protein
MIKYGNFDRPDTFRGHKSIQWLVIELTPGIVLAFRALVNCRLCGLVL